jgi:hypothetical protein
MKIIESSNASKYSVFENDIKRIENRSGNRKKSAGFGRQKSLRSSVQF